MTWLRTILAETWGLFVDDGVLAASILIWVALGAAVLPRIASPPWSPLILFAGLAAILVESARRRSRKP